MLFIIIFYRNKKKPKERDIKNFFKILFVVFVLFCEWFYQHPALRYGGYSLLALMFFLPTSLFLSNCYIERKNKKKLVSIILITSLIIFNVRNIIRVNKEMKIYDSSSFPFFYISKGNFDLINLNKNINIYIPKNIDSCWATKTPCVASADHLTAKKIFGFNTFLNKNKLE